MTRITFALGLSVIAGTLFLGGCGSLPIHSTFDSLTNETSLRTSDDFDYSTFVSVSGLVPQHGVQMIFHQPFFYDMKPNSPNYSIGLAPMRTFISERKFSMTGSDNDNAKAVAAIRDGLDEARLLSASLAALLVKKEAAETLKSLVEKGKEGKPTAEQAAILKSLLGSDVVKDDGTLDTVKVNSALALIASDAEKLKSSLNAKLLDAKKLGATRNVVITRWARERRNAFSASLSEWFALGGQGREAKSGILVFGDIRTVTLHTGDDFIDMLKGIGKHYREFVKDSGITVFTIQAKHGAYSTDLDMEQAVSIQLNLTKDQLHSLSNTFRDVNLIFSGNFGVVLDSSNSAFLGSSSVVTEPRCFFPPPAYEESVKREIKASNGYQLLYAVRAQLKDDLFDKAVKAKVSTPLSTIVKQCSEGKDDASFDDCVKNESNKLENWLAKCDPSEPQRDNVRMNAINQTPTQDLLDALHLLKK